MAKLALTTDLGRQGEELEVNESHENILCLITFHIQEETRCQYCHAYLEIIYTGK